MTEASGPATSGIRIPAVVEREVSPGCFSIEKVTICIQPADLAAALGRTADAGRCPTPGCVWPAGHMDRYPCGVRLNDAAKETTTP